MRDNAGGAPVRVRWAPRVAQAPIRRLYELEAQGVLDEDLLADVASAVYARCRAILRATDALNGRVHCPGCGIVVLHDGRADTLLACDGCGWEMSWRTYHRTFQGKKLYAGGAVDAFAGYVSAFDRAASPREVLLAIDRLLHTFHHELGEWPTAPAAKNVIEGNIQEVVALLDGLAYGDATPPEVRAVRERYLATLSRSWVSGVLPDKVRAKLQRREARRAADAGRSAAG